MYSKMFCSDTCNLSTIFCPSTESLKQTKKLFSNYGLHTTKTVSCEVSDGVGVGTVWQATWMWVQTPQARCVNCRHLFWRQLTQQCPLSLLPRCWGTSRCPNVRVRPGAPMLGWGTREGGGVVGLKITNFFTGDWQKMVDKCHNRTNNLGGR